MSRLVNRLFVGAFLIGAGHSGLARAHDIPRVSSGLYLSWVRTEGAQDCADASRIALDVEQRLGVSPFVSSSGPSASIETVVTRDRLRWRAAIVMRRADGSLLGSREVQSEAPTCESLARASALAMALMIETAASELGVLPPPSPASDDGPASLRPTPDPALVAGRPPADSAHSDEHARPSFSLTGGVLCATGVLPGLACGATLRTELELHGPLSLAIAVALIPERAVVREGSNVAFGLSYASLGGCYGIDLNDFWSVSPCGSLLVGASNVTVEAPTPVSAGQRLWRAGATGLNSSLQYEAFQLHVGVEAIFPLDRRDYVVERGEPVERVSSYREPALGAAATLMAGVHF